MSSERPSTKTPRSSDSFKATRVLAHTDATAAMTAGFSVATLDRDDSAHTAVATDETSGSTSTPFLRRQIERTYVLQTLTKSGASAAFDARPESAPTVLDRLDCDARLAARSRNSSSPLAYRARWRSSANWSPSSLSRMASSSAMALSSCRAAAVAALRRTAASSSESPPERAPISSRNAAPATSWLAAMRESSFKNARISSFALIDGVGGVGAMRSVSCSATVPSTSTTTSTTSASSPPSDAGTARVA